MDDLKLNEYKDILLSMDNLSSKIEDIIALNYFDKDKYLFSLYIEAFNSAKAFSVLLGNGFLIAQACTVLRLMIENVSTINILENHPEVKDDYIEHFKYRFSIRNEKRQRKLIVEHYKDIVTLKENNALDYLDYGWINKITNDIGYHSLIKTAGFDDIYQWIDQLNMWVHGAISSVNIFFDDNAIKYAHYMIDIVAKLFDHVCCDFHRNTMFDFIIDGFDYFKKFRNAYKKIINNDIIC